MFRRAFARIASTLVASTWLIAVTVNAGAQEKARTPAPDVEKVTPPSSKTTQIRWAANRWTAREAITKMLAAYDTKPHPLPPIPDDPPPHEGAMIGLPNTVEPPDLVLVEVLEALPARPISGERLVRADGTIDLGFYGEIYIRGLTPQQIEVVLIKHLRMFLSDETLGLMVPAVEDAVEQLGPPEPRRSSKPVIPELPQGDENLFQELEKPRASSDRSDSSSSPRVLRRSRRKPIAVRQFRARVARVAAQVQQQDEEEPKPIQIDAGGKGRVTVTIDLAGGRPADAPEQPEPSPVLDYDGPWRIVPPEAATTVFVDITAYNTKNYYVLGDVLVPGRLPWTGNETVLDAMQHAQGLIPSADPKNIRLVRPGRGGKPAKIYTIDLVAIQEKGDTGQNYQLFPGDRLIIGRDEVVKKTVELDRLNAPLQTVVGTMLQTASALRYLQIVNPEQSDKLLKEFVNFWAKEVSRKGDLKLDEQKLREFLLHELKAGAPLSTPAPKPR